MTAQVADCYCSAGPGPHKHAPGSAAHPLDMAHVPVSGAVVTLPWALEGAAPAQPLPPRPGPRPGPLYGVQYLRREALRLAIELHRDAADIPGDVELLATANRFAAFIRDGHLPTREQET